MDQPNQQAQPSQQNQQADHGQQSQQPQPDQHYQQTYQAQQAGNAQPQFQPMTAQSWSAAFQQTYGREPTMSEYQQAVTAGQILQEPDSTVQQMTDEARQLAAGVKSFYNENIAPTVNSAAESAQKMIDNDQSAAGKNLGSLINVASYVLPGAAFLGIIALFLPMSNLLGLSLTFFTPGVGGGHGPMLLVLMLIVIGVSVGAFFVHDQRMRLATGIVGVLVGVIMFFGSFHGMVSISGSAASVGIGLVLLLLVGLVLAAAGVLVLLGMRVNTHTKSQQ